MKKLFSVSLPVLFLLFFAGQSVIAQDFNLLRDETSLNPMKIELHQQTVQTESNEVLLFDNGPFITLPGGGCAGGNASILDNSAGGPGHTIFGWGFQQNLGNWMADDFTNTETWNLDSIKFYAYQTGATTSTITGGYIQIWNGAPNAGGTVVWGDLTTNRMIRTGLTNMYRALITTPTDCTRRLQEVVCAVNASLPPGNYWVQFAVTGSAASGPWCLPITITGQAVTGNALQLTGTTWANALNGPHQNGAPFLVYGTSGSVGPGPATNPSPANGATGVSAPNATLSWTNPAGATSNNVFFGTAPGSLIQIHTGSLISSIGVSNLGYSTTYYWRVDEIGGTGTTTGSTWSFTTMADPLISMWCDPFANLANWTILGPLGMTNWTANPSTFAGGTAPELRMSWTPQFNGESRLRSSVINFPTPLPNNTQTHYSFRFHLDWFANPSGTVQVLITWNGGTTTTPIYTLVDPTGNVGPLTVTGSFTSPASGPVNLQAEIVYTGNSFNIDFIYWDDLCFWWIIPVELTSFTADTRNNDVVLNWTTASEMNNQGFEVEKSINGVFQKIGYVAGHGTTTETQNYSYVDKNVGNGTHTYRLKQVDFDGTFTYSQEVFVDIAVPARFTLEQNYPNPFNPATKIEFGLAVDSKVNVKVFDILGQQIATLVDASMAAGFHSVDFDASGINSGVYFYTIEAVGNDGQKFSQTKKMMIMK